MEIDPFFVAAVKAIPTVVLLGPLLLWLYCRQKPLVSNTGVLPRFLLIALIAQVIGNVGFQISLGSIGLAASVPITLGVLLIGGAFLGRFLLGESVRGASLIAIGLLLAAVIVLCLGKPTAPRESSLSGFLLFWGGGGAAAAGFAYAIFGSVMRQTMHRGVSPWVAMFLSGSVGTFALWIIVFCRLETTIISAVTSTQWVMMTIAGLTNLLAFVSLAYCLKALPVVAVNLINGSQVAMAAIAGVLLFAEPITPTLLVGVGLTITGLAVLIRSQLRERKLRTRPPLKC